MPSELAEAESGPSSLRIWPWLRSIDLDSFADRGYGVLTPRLGTFVQVYLYKSMQEDL